MSIGPGSQTPLHITSALSNTLLDHTKYVANLNKWQQFLIWRYTLGSGALNATLVGVGSDEQKVFWVYNFFSSYNYPLSILGAPFKMYKQYFTPAGAQLYLYKVNEPTRLAIAKAIITKYIAQLEAIILNAPVVKEAFTVYKVSSKYPDLPDYTQFHNNDVNIVDQKPFNSTTYNPQFNFAPFTAPENTCCIHIIDVPKGSHLLMIPAEFHAYPHEMEALLPFGAAFDIQGINEEEFDYIPKENQKFIAVQDKRHLVIGQVFMVDPTSDNRVVRKQMTYYISTLISK